MLRLSLLLFLGLLVAASPAVAGCTNYSPSGYPWQQNACLYSSDLNAAIAGRAAGPFWVNVQAAPYNAKGNATTDDSAAIQAAITAASANNGTVFFPAPPGGGYCVKSTLNVNATIALIGVNRQSDVIFSCGGADIQILNLNAFRITVRGLRIEGSNIVGTTHETLTMTSSCSECLLDDVLVNFGEHAIGWYSGEAYINDVKAFGSYGSLVFMQGGAGKIIRGKLDSTWPAGSPGYNTQPANAPAAWASATPYTATTSVVVVNGYMLQATQSGTSGGTIPTVLPYGQTITDGSVHWQLAGPYLNPACSSSGTPVCGAIQIDSGSGAIEISHTDTTGAYFAGISLSNTLGTTAPQSVNIINSDDLGQYYEHGVSTVAGVAGLTIDGSVNITNCLSANCDAVNLIGSTNVKIKNNLIFNVRNPIVLSSSSTYTLIEGNQFGLCVNGVIVSAGITDFVIADNLFGSAVWGTCSSNTVDVLVGASDYYNITNNDVHGLAVSDGGTGMHKTVSGNN